MREHSVLIVDDEAGIRHGLDSFFRREGFAVHTADSFDAAVEVAARESVDCAIVDVLLKGSRTGTDLLEELKRLEPDLVVIVITGFGSIDSAVTSLKGGAADYLLKPVDNKRLLSVVRKNLELRLLKTENSFLRDELARRSLQHELITQDPAVRGLLATADKVKDTPVTVLLTGESGTGKEVLARYIHFTSTRRDAPFISLNCAALSESLLLSELFGHERGAFTGAVERKRGKFELADGGTLFLDEVGDMSPEIQAKLLRVIEDESFERVGGTKRIEVDVRLIAATNRDLTALIQRGSFREDLYYRLHVATLCLPPLRDRPGDVPLLARHFLTKYSERYGKELHPLSSRTLAALQAWRWPGNVRELENTVNQMVLLGELEHLVPTASPAPEVVDAGAAAPAGLPLKEALAGILSCHEERIVREALARNHGNRSRTARELEVTRKTLMRKLERYGIR